MTSSWQGKSTRLWRREGDFLASAAGGRQKKTARYSKPETSSPASCSKRAIIIVDHGSRRAESNQQLEDFVALYREMHGANVAIAAHMEIAQPSISEAFAQCVEAGAASIVIAPYFLSQGRHIQQDIPALVAEAQAQYPDVKCIIADPIGIDRTVADVIHNRVTKALGEAGN